MQFYQCKRLRLFLSCLDHLSLANGQNASLTPFYSKFIDLIKLQWIMPNYWIKFNSPHSCCYNLIWALRGQSTLCIKKIVPKCISYLFRNFYLIFTLIVPSLIAGFESENPLHKLGKIWSLITVVDKCSTNKFI